MEASLSVGLKNKPLEHTKDTYIFLAKKYSAKLPGLFARPLTGREAELLFYTLHGMSNKEIADKMCITEKTVKHHCLYLLKKTKCKNKIAVIIKFGNCFNYDKLFEMKVKDALGIF